MPRRAQHKKIPQVLNLRVFYDIIHNIKSTIRPGKTFHLKSTHSRATTIR
jgi:hypothetical protein